MKPEIETLKKADHQLFRSYASHLFWMSLSEEERRRVLENILGYTGRYFPELLEKYDPDDPEKFLLILAQRIDRHLLEGKIKETATVPTAKIREWVEAYNEHLEKTKLFQIKRRAVDYKQARPAYEKYWRDIEGQMIHNWETFKRARLLAEMSSVRASDAKIPQVAREDALSADELQKTLIKQIAEVAKIVGAGEPEKPLTPGSPAAKEIAEKVLGSARVIAVTPRYPEPLPAEMVAKTERPLVSPAQQKRLQAEENLETNLRVTFAQASPTYKAREVVKTAETLKEVLLANLNARVELGEFREAEAKKLLEIALERARGRIDTHGIPSLTKDQINSFVKETIRHVQRCQLSLPQYPALPKEVLEKLEADPQATTWANRSGAVFSHISALAASPLTPLAVLSVREAIALGHPYSEELELMAEEGVFVEDIAASLEYLRKDYPTIKALEKLKEKLIKFQEKEELAEVEANLTRLRKTNLAPDHPTFIILESLEERLAVAQKAFYAEDVRATIRHLEIKEGARPDDPRIIALKRLEEGLSQVQEKAKVGPAKILPLDKDGRVDFPKLPNKPGAQLLELRSRPAKVSGTKKPVYIAAAGIFLPRYAHSPKTTGLVGSLRRAEIKARLASGLWKQREVVPGYTEIIFVPTQRLARAISSGRFETLRGTFRFAYQQTIGRGTSFLLDKGKAFLARLGLDKILAAGTQLLKKLGLKIATKLALDLGLLGAGAAAAIPTGGLSVIIPLALKALKIFLGPILDEVWHKIKMSVKSLFEKPERAAGMLVLGAAAMTLPGVFPAIGAVTVVASIASLGSWGIASAGAIATAFVAKATALATTFAVSVSKSTLAWLCMALVIGSAIVTFFIVITTAGAFMLPSTPTEWGTGAPPPPSVPTMTPPPGLAFRWPVGDPYLCSSNYGYRTLNISGRIICDYHEGIDIPAAYGARAYSTATGTVYDIGFDSNYGHYVVIEHQGVFSFYAHLLGAAVSQGQEVDQSTIIGYVDNTGYSLGNHLHFGFSDCSNVPECFNNGSHTPDPCTYISCPAGCAYQDEATGCPGL